MTYCGGVEICEHEEKHEDIEKLVAERMPAEEELFLLADFFKVFGDSTRVRILYALFESEHRQYKRI